VKAEWLGLGALLSALLALSCCGTALLFLLFGISMASFGFLDGLAPYQLWFQLGSVVLLSAAWLRLYKRRACVRNSMRTFYWLLGMSLLLVVLLLLPYMDFS